MIALGLVLAGLFALFLWREPGKDQDKTGRCGH